MPHGISGTVHLVLAVPIEEARQKIIWASPASAVSPTGTSSVVTAFTERMTEFRRSQDLQDQTWQTSARVGCLLTYWDWVCKHLFRVLTLRCPLMQKTVRMINLRPCLPWLRDRWWVSCFSCSFSWVKGLQEWRKMKCNELHIITTAASGLWYRNSSWSEILWQTGFCFLWQRIELKAKMSFCICL